jgi:hypothetical protein
VTGVRGQLPRTLKSKEFPFMFDKNRIRLLVVACGQIMLLGLAGILPTNGAAATQTCQGTYAATPLQPLPPRIVVGLDIHDRSSRNLKLAERFLAGVREAGVAVGAEPNVLLHVNTSRLGDSSSRQNRGAEQSYSELSGVQGGMQLSLPALPSNRFAAPRPSSAPPLLFLRVDATEGSSPRILWVASVQCGMTSPDEGQLAKDLGRVIGGALGQRIERRPF